MKLRLGVLLCAFLLAPAARVRAVPVETTAAAPASAAPVTDPAIVAARYRQLLAEPQFQEPVEPDVDTRMKDWLSQFFTRFGARFGQFKYAQEMPRFASLLLSIFVLLSIVGLLYVLVRLTRSRARWQTPLAEDLSARRVFRPPEFYAEELRRAVTERDWHTAWLVSWRQFLSRLEKGRLVETDRSRTNREYLAQLRALPLTATAVALLDRLVDSYDVFIYGRRAIAEPDWKSFQAQVDEAGLLLHVADRPTSPSAESTP